MNKEKVMVLKINESLEEAEEMLLVMFTCKCGKGVLCFADNKIKDGDLIKHNGCKLVSEVGKE